MNAVAPSADVGGASPVGTPLQADDTVVGVSLSSSR
jgi:hypothetical protein